MRAVVQRVKRGSVTVKGRTLGQVARGFVVLLGVGAEDSPEDATYLAEKVANLRVFEDGGGKMNLSLSEVGGEVLVISQFTLYGDARKGRRPSFSQAAPPELGRELYERFVAELLGRGLTVATGEFGADMLVEIINDGPVTLLLDSRKVF
ncbi:MAG: D-aminoacyl-tRNA deacylase [Firmicutes bacterium]|nr:D-aminoacyl-tRNA deacylase [Bacillota bacterium]MCL5040305.1 D-aminoacyl-tRNA deacylase [Bacillota bacterium]